MRIPASPVTSVTVFGCSGADSSVLPAGYAPLLGYGRTDLDRGEGTKSAAA